MDNTVNGYIDQIDGPVASLWFAGSTAVKEGQGFCYNWDYGTATASEPKRGRYIEVPTITNSDFFAGVAKSEYPAVSGGQFIEIYLPGAVCNVWVTVDTVIGVGTVTFQMAGANAGLFTSAIGLCGRGTAQPLQTVTAGTGAVCLARLQDGPESGGQENIVVPIQ